MIKPKYIKKQKKKLVDTITGLKVRIYYLINKNRDYKAQLILIKKKLKLISDNIKMDTRNKHNW